MADEIDLANDQNASHNEASLAAHRAKMAAKAGQPSAEICGDCGEDIPEDRQRLVPGVQLCVECRTNLEKGRCK